tara:strand:- start:23922 stop:24023 length:102 start_codon:yes stop_codon:yes gene_type:complete
MKKYAELGERITAAMGKGKNRSAVNGINFSVFI